ncbi:MAG: urease accessory protein UreF [Pseudomonadota bacterium]
MAANAEEASEPLENVPASASETTALLTALSWFSPSFPIGAFSYSHGLEWAVETGWVTDETSLSKWIEGLLTNGSGWTDAVLFCEAWRRGASGQTTDDLCELAVALQPSAERLLETTAQGRAFLETVSAAWLPDASAMFNDDRSSHPYPVIAGALCATAGLPLKTALLAFVHGFVANLISAGQRIIPLGQKSGQIVTVQMNPVIEDVAARASTAFLDDLGGAAFRSDIASMQHETQYTRLFRS